MSAERSNALPKAAEINTESRTVISIPNSVHYGDAAFNGLSPLRSCTVLCTVTGTPNPATGQTSLIKGIHAVGYDTPQQAIWFTDLPIAVFPLIVLVVWAAKNSGYKQARESNGRRSTPTAIFWVIWIALLLGGGHWISLIKTGSWAFPNHHPV